MKLLLQILLPIGVLLSGCYRSDSNWVAKDPPPPLGDTLVAIYEDIRDAAVSDRTEDFVRLLVADEAERLKRISRSYGRPSLGWYLENQLGSWLDPDTLRFEGLVYEPPYARLALAGPGSSFGHREDRVRFTFFLFKRVKSSWRLAAVTTLEKERYDPYGTELSYLETELPSKLRFPRLF